MCKHTWPIKLILILILILIQPSLECAISSAGQAALVLHSMAVLQVFQAKLLAGTDEFGLDPTMLRGLRSVTDLALRATKTMAQAIGCSMASLVVLERHLWLTLTEIKDADKVPFLDAPVSPTGLLGPAVEGFAECFTEAQKSSQAMRLVLFLAACFNFSFSLVIV